MSLIRTPILGLALVTTIGVFALVAAAQQPGGVVPASQSVAAAPPQGDRSGQLLAEARASFTRVKDYMGTMVKEERVGGQMQPEQYISIRVRQQPFSVYLKWTGPKQFEGQEAMYVSGKNDNKVKARGSGFAGIVGYVSLDPADPRALKQSRHTITDTGIGHLIETLTRGHEMDRRAPAGQTQVSFREFMFQQKPCTGMETVHRANTGQFYCYRTVVYFDKQTKLPVRFEAYDWPAAGGTPGGEKLECYSYVDVKFNVGLTDAAFGL
ncbi:MAG TPA: DUF1571 domain-containing protein [Gemmataceae bacterium]|jgi:hypothetical protein|nr:DUF1571 domain-containing protein [Gemmataceae bacterium]